MEFSIKKQYDSLKQTESLLKTMRLGALLYLTAVADL